MLAYLPLLLLFCLLLFSTRKNPNEIRLLLHSLCLSGTKDFLQRHLSPCRLCPPLSGFYFLGALFDRYLQRNCRCALSWCLAASGHINFYIPKSTASLFEGCVQDKWLLASQHQRRAVDVSAAQMMRLYVPLLSGNLSAPPRRRCRWWVLWSVIVVFFVVVFFFASYFVKAVSQFVSLTFKTCTEAWLISALMIIRPQIASTVSFVICCREDGQTHTGLRSKSWPLWVRQGGTCSEFMLRGSMTVAWLLCVCGAKA